MKSADHCQERGGVRVRSVCHAPSSTCSCTWGHFCLWLAWSCWLLLVSRRFRPATERIGEECGDIWKQTKQSPRKLRVASSPQGPQIKGKTRFAVSVLAGIGSCAASLDLMVTQRQLWRGILILLLGGFLIWFGARKYPREPEGKTPSSKIL